MDALTEIETDAMSEVFNIAMGAAAYSLSQLVNDEIRLSVPEAQFLSAKEAKKILSVSVGSDLITVSERFSGSLSGKATLFFPESQSMELVRSMLSEDTPLEIISEMEEEAMIEISNIILNSCVGSIANFISGELRTEFPEYTKYNVTDDFIKDDDDDRTSNYDDRVLLLRTNFDLRSKDASGYVTLIMDISSEKDFRLALKKHLDETIGKICN